MVRASVLVWLFTLSYLISFPHPCNPMQAGFGRAGFKRQGPLPFSWRKATGAMHIASSSSEAGSSRRIPDSEVPSTTSVVPSRQVTSQGGRCRGCLSTTWDQRHPAGDGCGNVGWPIHDAFVVPFGKARSMWCWSRTKNRHILFRSRPTCRCWCKFTMPSTCTRNG